MNNRPVNEFAPRTVGEGASLLRKLEREIDPSPVTQAPKIDPNEPRLTVEYNGKTVYLNGVFEDQETLDDALAAGAALKVFLPHRRNQGYGTQDEVFRRNSSIGQD